MTKAQKAEQAEYIESLKAILKPGDTVYTVLRSVSKSGMNRKIGLWSLKPSQDGSLDRRWLSYMAAKALGRRFDDKTECVSVGGCGMDMGFHLVYTLAQCLYGDGYALKHEWL